MTLKYTNHTQEHKPSGLTGLEKISYKFTKWVGTPYSLIVHTAFFIGVFILRHFGFGANDLMLFLTTVVSLEAIYLAIFIQMTVNRTTESLEEVEEDIEDIQEGVTEEEATHKVILHISNELRVIQHDLNLLKKRSIMNP